MRVHASVLVQRPIEVVFEYLSTPEQLPEWLAGVAAVHGPLPDQQEVGSILVLDRRRPLGHTRSTWEVTAYEPPRSLALRGLDDAAARPEVRWTLEGVPPGATRVGVEADLDAASFFQPTATDLAELGMRQVQDNLQVLKQRVEAGA